jgi:hypothetical protein
VTIKDPEHDHILAIPSCRQLFQHIRKSSSASFASVENYGDLPKQASIQALKSNKGQGHMIVGIVLNVHAKASRSRSSGDNEGGRKYILPHFGNHTMVIFHVWALALN